MANLQAEVTNKFLFFGFIEKQDLLIRGWMNMELCPIVIICLLCPICVINDIAVMIWVAIYLIATLFLAINSTCKTANFYQIAKKASIVISNHKNRELKKIFRKGPRYLKMIIVLDCLYPITWVLSFLFKLAYLKNTNNMKNLITTKPTV